MSFLVHSRLYLKTRKLCVCWTIFIHGSEHIRWFSGYLLQQKVVFSA